MTKLEMLFMYLSEPVSSEGRPVVVCVYAEDSWDTPYECEEYRKDFKNHALAAKYAASLVKKLRGTEWPLWIRIQGTEEDENRRSASVYLWPEDIQIGWSGPHLPY